MFNSLNLKSLKFPAIMGILNLTPDSFSDGGNFFKQEISLEEKALAAALRMIQAGAQIIDLGGESSGPQSREVSFEEEKKRLGSVFFALRSKFNGIISIDTYKAGIAEFFIKNGADFINDVTAGRGDKKMFSVIADADVYYCLMYSKDENARTTLRDVEYKDVVGTVYDFLAKRTDLAIKSGIDGKKIIVDPGMGVFLSRNPKYSLEILHQLEKIKTLGFPVLVGCSRKSFLRVFSGEEKDSIKDRLIPSVFCSVYAMKHGADIVRVHDVKETVQGLKLFEEFL